MELSELYLVRADMTDDNILKLVRNAKKLKIFQLVTFGNNSTQFVGDTFKKLVEIVEQRHEKLKLHLYFDRNAFTKDIRQESIKAASNLLTVEYI